MAELQNKPYLRLVMQDGGVIYQIDFDSKKLNDLQRLMRHSTPSTYKIKEGIVVSVNRILALEWQEAKVVPYEPKLTGDE